MSNNGKKRLPSTWAVLTLGEVRVDWSRGIVPGKQPNDKFELYSVPSFDSGKPEIVQGQSIGSNKQTVEPDTVLLCKINPRINRVWVVENYSPYPKIASTEWIPFFCSSEFLPKYLCYYMRREEFRDHLASQASGVGGSLMRIKASTLASYPLPIAPLPEQHRIVAKIEELFSALDKGVESLKMARAKLKIYRQAVLKHAFEGKLTAQWREGNKDKLETPEQLLARIKREREARYEQQLKEWKAAVKKWEEDAKSGKRPTRLKMPKSVSTMAEEEIASLEALPSGWLWLTAESVGIVQLGRQRSPKNRSKDYPTKYIRAANITEQGLDLDDILDMDFLPHELSAYRLEKGDLVLSEASGSASQVGKPAIWDDQIQNCCFQNTVIRHQPYCRDYAVYLLWLYRFFYASGKFAQVAGGVGINHLSAFKFAQIAIPLCSLAEQQEIVRLLEKRFATIERQEREIDSALKQAETLRQALLKKAFNGQLVPQDPNDEPVSVLLDRIRAVREKAAENNHARKTKKRKTRA